MSMQYLLKRLLIILFLINFINSPSFAQNQHNAKILILDKSSSTKYELNFSHKIQFRNLSFELITCENIEFDKYLDEIALIRINQRDNVLLAGFLRLQMN